MPCGREDQESIPSHWSAGGHPLLQGFVQVLRGFRSVHLTLLPCLWFSQSSWGLPIYIIEGNHKLPSIINHKLIC